MRALVFCGIHEGLYSYGREVFVKIFEAAKNPLAAKQPFFGPEGVYQDEFDLQNDLTKEILPLVQKYLQKRSKYVVNEVSCDTQGDLPGVRIVKRDETVFTKKDKEELTALLDGMVRLHNLKCASSAITLFANPKRNEKETENAIRYKP